MFCELSNNSLVLERREKGTVQRRRCSQSLYRHQTIWHRYRVKWTNTAHLLQECEERGIWSCAGRPSSQDLTLFVSFASCSLMDYFWQPFWLQTQLKLIESVFFHWPALFGSCCVYWVMGTVKNVKTFRGGYNSQISCIALCIFSFTNN